MPSGGRFQSSSDISINLFLLVSFLILVFFVPVGRNHNCARHRDPHHAPRGTHHPCNEIWYGHTRVFRALSMSLTHPCTNTHMLLRSNSWCHWAHMGFCTLKSVGFKSPTGSSVWLKKGHHSLRISLSLSFSLFLSVRIWFHSFRWTTLGIVAVVEHQWERSLTITNTNAVFTLLDLIYSLIFFHGPVLLSSLPFSFIILSFLLI